MAVAGTAACTAGMRSPSLATLCCFTNFLSACIRQMSQDWSGRSGAEADAGRGGGERGRCGSHLLRRARLLQAKDFLAVQVQLTLGDLPGTQVVVDVPRQHRTLADAPERSRLQGQKGGRGWLGEARRTSMALSASRTLFWKMSS